MKNSLSFKNKLIFITIFAAALGITSLLPNNSPQGKESTQESDLTKNKSDSKSALTCDEYKSDLSVITQNQKENIASNSCLFIGCSGFNF